MPRIAHVEDNIADHVLLKKCLGQQHEIIHFKNLKSFLDSREIFDLVITDLGLPESYGYETIAKIRSQMPTIPLLALTGLGGPYMTGDIIRTLIVTGANNVVSKDIICDSRILSLIDELLS